MKCTKYNVARFCQTLEMSLEDENGRGEFDDESDLLSACERVIGWLEAEEIKSKKQFKELTKEQQKEVRDSWVAMKSDKSFECHKLCKTLNKFWENHKEMDFPEML